MDWRNSRYIGSVEGVFKRLCAATIFVHSFNVTTKDADQFYGKGLVRRGKQTTTTTTAKKILKIYGTVFKIEGESLDVNIQFGSFLISSKSKRVF